MGGVGAGREVGRWVMEVRDPHLKERDLKESEKSRVGRGWKEGVGVNCVVEVDCAGGVCCISNGRARPRKDILISLAGSP